MRAAPALSLAKGGKRVSCFSGSEILKPFFSSSLCRFLRIKSINSDDTPAEKVCQPSQHANGADCSTAKTAAAQCCFLPLPARAGLQERLSPREPAGPELATHRPKVRRKSRR